MLLASGGRSITRAPSLKQLADGKARQDDLGMLVQVAVAKGEGVSYRTSNSSAIPEEAAKEGIREEDDTCPKKTSIRQLMSRIPQLCQKMKQPNYLPHFTELGLQPRIVTKEQCAGISSHAPDAGSACSLSNLSSPLCPFPPARHDGR